MLYQTLSKSILFRGFTEREIEEMLTLLAGQIKSFQKNEIIFLAGETTNVMGLVLSGNVHIENTDVWGNKSLLGNIGVGEVFAETYACIENQPMLVSAVAAEDSEVLLIDISLLLTQQEDVHSFQSKFIYNLLYVTAEKNLHLSRRIFHTSPKSIRGKLSAYLSDVAILKGKTSFTIPFNRQQLADYLNVDRSAMSHELSKMQKEGLLTYKRNDFNLNRSFAETE